MKLDNRVVLVTGSSSGIGRAVACRFAEHGAQVVVHSRSSVAEGEKVAREIRDRGGRAIYIQADLEVQEDVKRLFTGIMDRHGRIDVLINNAGNPTSRPFLETDFEFWRYNMHNIFLTAVMCSIDAAKIMKAQGSGRIINTASMRGLGHSGRPASMAYSAGKAALINFTQNLAKELAPEITVNAVAPGFVSDTAFLDRATDTIRESWLKETPLGRFISPEELADAFIYLAGADAVTGEVLVVDGGFNLKLA